jgi:negative regulator of replication initiation
VLEVLLDHVLKLRQVVVTHEFQTVVCANVKMLEILQVIVMVYTRPFEQRQINLLIQTQVHWNFVEHCLSQQFAEEKVNFLVVLDFKRHR